MVESLNLPGSAKSIRQIADVLEKKNLVEYESREFSQREAEDVRQKSARLLGWVTEQLRK